MSAWSAGTSSWRDAIGLVGGIGVLGAFLASLRRGVRVVPSHAHSVNWVDLGAAVVTAIEAWHLHHQGKHGLPIAYGVTAVLLFAAGMFHEHLSRWRRLVISPTGFDCRPGLRTRVRVAWSDVDQVHRVGTRMRILRKDKQEVWLDCSDALNAVQLLDAIESAASPHLRATIGSDEVNLPAPPQRRHPLAVAAVGRTVALGFGLAIVPAAIWSAALAANLATSPRVPWSVLTAAAMLLALGAALRAAGSSVSIAGAIASRVPRQSLTVREWLWTTTAAVGTTLAGMSAVFVVRVLLDGPPTAPPGVRSYSWWLVALYAGTGSVLAGVFEEVAFRGYTQSGLEEQLGRAGARWAVAAAFTLLHVCEPSFAWLATVYAGTSVALSSLVYRCQSVWPGAVGHTVANVVSFGLWIGVDPVAHATSTPALGATIACGLVAALVARLAFLQVRGSREANATPREGRAIAVENDGEDPNQPRGHDARLR